MAGPKGAVCPSRWMIGGQRNREVDVDVREHISPCLERYAWDSCGRKGYGDIRLKDRRLLLSVYEHLTIQAEGRPDDMRKGVGRNNIGIAGPSGAARHTGGRPSCRSGKTVMALCAEAADDNLRRRRGKRRKMLLRAETFFPQKRLLS